MNSYTPRQYVELFHLLFLIQLGQKLDKKSYALKGGCNLRFFFNSPRYSDDIDIDIQEIAVDVLRKRIGNVLNSKPFRDILQVRDIKIHHITEHKQTATTQRWKLGLMIPKLEMPLPTRIEFSRRGLNESFQFDWVDSLLLRVYKLPPVSITHYSAEIACLQKIKALISRNVAQARDVFDLHILLASRVKEIAPSEEVLDKLARARENILSLDFAVFKSQVVSFLEPEIQPQYDSEEVWDAMRMRVLEALRGE